MSDLITVPELLLYMPTLATVDPVVLQSYITVASDLVRKFCNRELSYGTFSERVYYGPLLATKVFAAAQINLYLKNYPVDTITNIEIVGFTSGFCNQNGQFNNLGSEDNVTNTVEKIISWNVPYVVQKDNGFVQLQPSVNPCPWWYSLMPNQFIVNYSGGYQEIPAPVRMATSMIVKQQYEYNTQQMLLSSERIGDYEYRRANMSPDLSGLSIPQGSVVKQLLLPYQRKGINGL